MLVTAGKKGLRLFVCSEETVERVKRIRGVVEEALKIKFLDNKEKWDSSTKEGKILQGLISLLLNDKDV